VKILLLDTFSCCFLDFALRAEAQGHEVRLWVAPDKHDGHRIGTGDGLVNRIENWQSSARWADIIMVSDNAKYVREIDALKRRGFPVFYAGAEPIKWEMERQLGQQVMEQHGIECLPTTHFKNYDEAIAFQKAHMDIRYVCKPCADVDKALSYVSKGGKDMIFMLEKWKKQFRKPIPFIFQEFCPGIEVAVGGWMGRNGFLRNVLENFEFKKLCNNDCGPNTGEMGTVMKYTPIEQSKLAQELLLPLEAELIRQNYTSYIDVAVMVGTEGERKGKLNPLEFTCRHGWPLFQIQQALHHDVANWIKDALDGFDTFVPVPGIALGIVVGMPDFPYGHLKEDDLTGYPIWGITAENRYNFHPIDMKLGKGIDDKGNWSPMMVTSGNNPCVVTGTGPTISLAKKHAYSNLKELEIPNSPIYRTDIGDRLEKQLPELQKHGYCTSWIF
jgi:phosphoribosylamine-glycine ligase